MLHDLIVYRLPWLPCFITKRFLDNHSFLQSDVCVSVINYMQILDNKTTIHRMLYSIICNCYFTMANKKNNQPYKVMKM